MRDSHRMKEKYDLSLDNRQIVSFLIGALVVLGSVFVLGVVVGKQLTGPEGGPAAPDLLPPWTPRPRSARRSWRTWPRCLP
jgi:DedD protein